MDRSAIAFQVVALGMGVTLTALFLLYLMLNLFGRLFVQQKKNASKPEVVATAKPAVSVRPPLTGLDGRLVAAIVGPISTLLLEEQAKQPFKISIAPSLETGFTSKAWVLTGRKELMTGALKLAALRRKESHAEI